jgi:hypothetical protein
MSNEPTGLLVTEAAEYVLPSPPRSAGEVVVIAPPHDRAAWRRGGEVARAFGERFLALGETQQLFAAELRERLQTLDAAIADASRAQLKGAVHDVLAVLDWCDAAQADLVRECRLAAAGKELLDVTELCEVVAAERLAAGQQVSVVGRLPLPWWGEALALADLVAAAITVVVERAAGAAVVIEIAATPAGAELHIASRGEPGDGVDAETIRRFRAAVERIGASVRPDQQGPGGCGMRVLLPS